MVTLAADSAGVRKCWKCRKQVFQNKKQSNYFASCDSQYEIYWSVSSIYSMRLSDIFSALLSEMSRSANGVALSQGTQNDV